MLTFQNKDDEALAALDSILVLYRKKKYHSCLWFKQAEEMKNNILTLPSNYQDIVTTNIEDILADDALYHGHHL
ncbi:MAG: hypothetical protein R2847_06970 [Bacteroidia bacterium]